MKLKSLTLMLALSVSATSIKAGGLLTNTNQSIAFLRSLARDGAIGIDGVYSNPAGVAFLPRDFTSRSACKIFIKLVPSILA